MKYQKKGIKGTFITDEAFERITKRGGSNLLLALFMHLKHTERQYCTPKKDYFSQSNEQIMGEMGISRQTVQNLKGELVRLGLAEIWQAKLPASRRGRMLHRTTSHITYYRLLY